MARKKYLKAYTLQYLNENIVLMPHSPLHFIDNCSCNIDLPRLVQSMVPRSSGLETLGDLNGQQHINSRYKNKNGFTLIELVSVITILGILAAVAVPKYLNLAQSARIASLNGLAGSVNTAMTLLHNNAIVSNNLGQQNGTVSARVGDVDIRIWNGWPDRWWDGIGISLVGASPSSGGYLSTSPYPFGSFTFYGYGSSNLPNNLCGWRIETAPDPKNCSVTYDNNGSGRPPVVTVYTSGC